MEGVEHICRPDGASNGTAWSGRAMIDITAPPHPGEDAAKTQRNTTAAPAGLPPPRPAAACASKLRPRPAKYHHPQACAWIHLLRTAPRSRWTISRHRPDHRCFRRPRDASSHQDETTQRLSSLGRPAGHAHRPSHPPQSMDVP